MIDKREILETASSLGLQPSVVEKDYVLGWLLAGIYAHPELTDSWVFKGGTCLKKCYFETYRFSEDLDFTLRDEAGLDESFLQRVLGEVVEWVSDESGLTIPADQLSFDIYENPRGWPSCQGKVGYRGPVYPTSGAGGWPKIRLDLTSRLTPSNFSRASREVSLELADVCRSRVRTPPRSVWPSVTYGF